MQDNEATFIPCNAMQYRYINSKQTLSATTNISEKSATVAIGR